MDRPLIARIRSLVAVFVGLAALASIMGLVLAIPLAGPVAGITWTLAKVAACLVALSMLASLAAGGKRGLLGFASGIACLASVALVLATIGRGMSGAETGPLLGFSVVLFGLLAVATASLALAAGLARWHRLVQSV